MRSLDLHALDLGGRGSDPLSCAHRPLVEGGAGGSVTIGVWEAGPGVDEDVEVDEAFLVLSGAGTIGYDDGSAVPLAPGAVVRLREGEHTTWQITERLRKVYVSSPALATTSGTRVLTTDARTMPLSGASHSGHWVEGGWPSATAELLDRFGSTRVGLWESTAGVVADIERDEALVVVSGTGSARFEADGTLAALRPGVLLRQHEGERAEWTIASDLRASPSPSERPRGVRPSRPVCCLRFRGSLALAPQPPTRAGVVWTVRCDEGRGATKRPGPSPAAPCRWSG